MLLYSRSCSLLPPACCLPSPSRPLSPTSSRTPSVISLFWHALVGGGLFLRMGSPSRYYPETSLGFVLMYFLLSLRRSYSFVLFIYPGLRCTLVFPLPSLFPSLTYLHLYGMDDTPSIGSDRRCLRDVLLLRSHEGKPRKCWRWGGTRRCLLREVSRR